MLVVLLWVYFQGLLEPVHLLLQRVRLVLGRLGRDRHYVRAPTLALRLQSHLDQSAEHHDGADFGVGQALADDDLGRLRLDRLDEALRVRVPRHELRGQLTARCLLVSVSVFLEPVRLIVCHGRGFGLWSEGSILELALALALDKHFAAVRGDLDLLLLLAQVKGNPTLVSDLDEALEGRVRQLVPERPHQKRAQRHL